MSNNWDPKKLLSCKNADILDIERDIKRIKERNPQKRMGYEKVRIEKKRRNRFTQISIP